MGDPLAGKNVLHVAAGPRMFTLFRMPMIRAHRRRAGRCVLYLPAHPENRALAEEGFELCERPVTNRPGWWSPLEALRLLAHLLRERFDVVVAHQPMGALVGIPAARAAGVPVRIYSTGGLRHVPGAPGLRNRLLWSGEQHLVRWSTITLLNNRDDERFLAADADLASRALWVGAKGGCGYDAERFHAGLRAVHRERMRAALGLADDRLTAIYVGRFAPDKGARECVAAMAALPRGTRLDLLMIGEGAERAALESEARQRALPIRFLGFRADLPELLTAADVLLLPSRREGLPTVAIEAMAVGLPVIASDIRGNHEVVTPGDNGFLTPPGDIDALARLLATLEVDALARLGEEASRRAAERWSEAALWPRTERALDDRIGRALDEA